MRLITGWIFCLMLLSLNFNQLVNAQSIEQTGVVLNDKKVLWGATPKESLIKPMLNKYVVNEMIDIRTIEGHHFNLKANNNCQMMPAKNLSQNFMQCQFGEAGNYKINMFICDDKESFCKFEKLSVDVSAPRGYKAALKKHVSSNILYVPKASLSAPPGFIKNRPTFVFEQARKSDQPVLIVFAAQWCPACNMMDENIFQSTQFQSETKNLVKLILDVDSDISWELKEKYKIGGYPTTILTTSTKNEISRFVGYRSPQAISQWLRENLSLKNEPIELVISKVERLQETQDSVFKFEYDRKVIRLANWYLDSDQPEMARAVLQKTKHVDSKKLLLLADLRISQKKNDTESTQKILSELIKENANDINVSSWGVELSSLQPEKFKFQDEIKKNVEMWVASDKIELAELSRAELYSNLGQVYEALGKTDLSKESYLNCADEYKRLSILSHLKNPRGANMEMGFCLAKAGKTQEALKTFESLVKAYKGEFAFNYYYARTLLDSGDTKKAYQYVKNSLDNSYGDNMIRAATLKAQIEVEMKDLMSAEKTVNQTLSKVYLPSATDIRTHRYVANLKGVMAKILVQKEAQKELGKREAK